MATETTVPPFDLDEDLLELSITEKSHPVFNALTLIGKVISDKTLNFKAIKSILLTAWNLDPYLSIISLDRNLFACVFIKDADHERILQNSPWEVKGHIIIFKHWSSSLTISELQFTTSPFWVQIHNLPLNRITLENAEKIGNFLGSFLSHDTGSPSTSVTSYLRIRVLLNVAKALKTGIFIRREDESSLWVSFKYERLSDFCYLCGRLGHVQSQCCSSPLPLHGAADPRIAFGPWMRCSQSIPRDDQRTKSSSPPDSTTWTRDSILLVPPPPAPLSPPTSGLPHLPTMHHHSPKSHVSSPVRTTFSDISRFDSPPQYSAILPASQVLGPPTRSPISSVVTPPTISAQPIPSLNFSATHLNSLDQPPHLFNLSSLGPPTLDNPTQVHLPELSFPHSQRAHLKRHNTTLSVPNKRSKHLSFDHFHSPSLCPPPLSPVTNSAFPSILDVDCSLSLASTLPTSSPALHPHPHQIACCLEENRVTSIRR